MEFWRERLGFEIANEVSEGERLGFVMLVKDDVTIMYQSKESLKKDLKALAKAADGESALLLLQVEDIDAIERAMAGADIVVPRLKTFYGSTEIGVREPGGHVVLFAQFAGEQTDRCPASESTPPRCWTDGLPGGYDGATERWDRRDR